MCEIVYKNFFYEPSENIVRHIVTRYVINYFAIFWKKKGQERTAGEGVRDHENLV